MLYFVEMAKGDALGEFEQIVLLAILRLREEAYGMTVRREIEARTGRESAIGAVARNRIERGAWRTSAADLRTDGSGDEVVGTHTASAGQHDGRIEIPAGMNHVTPPRMAALLLTWAAPREYRDALAGDLDEEYVRHGRTRLWYWRQVARSLPELLALRMRRSRWEEPAAVFLMAAAWMLVGWHLVWSFVMSQVPLKADPVSWF